MHKKIAVGVKCCSKKSLVKLHWRYLARERAKNLRVRKPKWKVDKTKTNMAATFIIFLFSCVFAVTAKQWNNRVISNRVNGTFAIGKSPSEISKSSVLTPFAGLSTGFNRIRKKKKIPEWRQRRKRGQQPQNRLFFSLILDWKYNKMLLFSCQSLLCCSSTNKYKIANYKKKGKLEKLSRGWQLVLWILKINRHRVRGFASILRPSHCEKENSLRNKSIEII